MRILKKIGLLLLLFVVGLTALGLLLPRQVHVERSLTMKAAPAAIFAEINTVRNWPHWSPWHNLDPNMQLTYSGPAAGQGASYAWTSEQSNVGNGTCTVTASRPFERIDTSMDFDGNGTATSTYLLQPTPAGTRVTWTMDSDMGFNPIGRYVGLMMDRWVGADFDRGLAQLRQVVETPAVARH